MSGFSAPGRSVVFAPIAAEHHARLAQIHARALPDSFLPRLGTAFLQALYDAMFGCGAVRGVVALVDGRVAGFCCWAPEPDWFGRTLRFGSWRLALRALGALLRRPWLVGSFLETLRYGGRSSVSGVVAEVLVLAVEGEERRSGTGTALLDAAEQPMREAGIASFKVTVHADNAAAIAFYRSRGYEVAAEFTQYGRPWLAFRGRVDR